MLNKELLLALESTEVIKGFNGIVKVKGDYTTGESDKVIIKRYHAVIYELISDTTTTVALLPCDEIYPTTPYHSYDYYDTVNIEIDDDYSDKYVVTSVSNDFYVTFNISYESVPH